MVRSKLRAQVYDYEREQRSWWEDGCGSLDTCKAVRTMTDHGIPKETASIIDMVNIVCGWNSDRGWDSEANVATHECSIQRRLGYDIEVPCVVQWRNL